MIIVLFVGGPRSIIVTLLLLIDQLNHLLLVNAHAWFLKITDILLLLLFACILALVLHERFESLIFSLKC